LAPGILNFDVLPIFSAGLQFVCKDNQIRILLSGGKWKMVKFDTSSVTSRSSEQVVFFHLSFTGVGGGALGLRTSVTNFATSAASPSLNLSIHSIHLFIVHPGQQILFTR
jgi:hypothetical protein